MPVSRRTCAWSTLACALLTGCGSLISLMDPPQEDYVLGGARTDVDWSLVREDPSWLGLFMAFDLPFSVVMDCGLLPLTYILQIKHTFNWWLKGVSFERAYSYYEEPRSGGEWWTAYLDDTLHLWHGQEGVQHWWAGPGGGVDPSGAFLIVPVPAARHGPDRGETRVYQLDRGMVVQQAVCVIGSEVNALVRVGDQHVVTARDLEGAITLWSLAPTPHVVATLEMLAKHPESSERLPPLVGWADGRVGVLRRIGRDGDAQDLELLVVNGGTLELESTHLVSTGGHVVDVAWSQDARYLAVVRAFHTVEVHELDGRTHEPRSLARHSLPNQYWPRSIAISRDGQLIAVSHNADRRGVSLWKRGTAGGLTLVGERVRSRKVGDVAMTADGSLIAAPYSDGVVLLWRIR